MNNDQFGDYCQELVLNYFLNEYDTFTQNKGTNGHDLTIHFTNHTLKIEVKGISDLFKQNNQRFQSNGFKFELEHLKPDTTHFAFVIQDRELIPTPRLFLIPANDIFQHINRKTKPTSKFFRLPLYWIKNNFTPIKLT